MNDESTPNKTSVFKISWYLFLFVVFSVVMKYSQDVLLPLVISFILYFCFCPLIDRLESSKVNRWVTSVLLILTICFGVFTGLYHLSNPMNDIFQTSSKNLGKIEKKLIIFKKPMESLSKAEKKVDELTDVTGGKLTKVQIQNKSVSGNVFDRARSLTLNFFTTMVFFFFLLMYGDTLFCKLGNVLPYAKGSNFSGSLLRKIQYGTCRYVLTITIINSVLGMIVGTALYLQGFPNPFLWGAVAGLLNFIPYIGCVIGVGLVFLVSLTNSGNNFEIILPAATYFILNTLEGQFLTPMIVGNALNLNPLVILLSLIYWGAIWGVAGLFVAIPILIILQIIGTHSNNLVEWTEALKL